MEIYKNKSGLPNLIDRPEYIIKLPYSDNWNVIG